ncbi:hypothetical protein LV779_02100 [Streptomyces thinghirensis]|nr:hypothetical protein [Streptomyces thinghirensis]
MAAAVVLSLLSAAATLVLPLQVRDLVMALAGGRTPRRPAAHDGGPRGGRGLASALSYLPARPCR